MLKSHPSILMRWIDCTLPKHLTLQWIIQSLLLLVVFLSLIQDPWNPCWSHITLSVFKGSWYFQIFTQGRINLWSFGYEWKLILLYILNQALLGGQREVMLDALCLSSILHTACSQLRFTLPIEYLRSHWLVFISHMSIWWNQILCILGLGVVFERLFLVPLGFIQDASWFTWLRLISAFSNSHTWLGWRIGRICGNIIRDLLIRVINRRTWHWVCIINTGS